MRSGREVRRRKTCHSTLTSDLSVFLRVLFSAQCHLFAESLALKDRAAVVLRCRLAVRHRGRLSRGILHTLSQKSLVHWPVPRCFAGAYSQRVQRQRSCLRQATCAYTKTSLFC